MGKEKWAGAVDNLGGDVLSLITSQMKWGGLVASIGLAASYKYETTVMPFILRNVGVLGIDSVNAPFKTRQRVWARLAKDLEPKKLESIVTTVRLEDLPGVFERMIEGSTKGRTVVRIGE